jgi:hypothetical protein
MKRLIFILFLFCSVSGFSQIVNSSILNNSQYISGKKLTVAPAFPPVGFVRTFNLNDSLHFMNSSRDWNLGKIIYQDSLGYYYLKTQTDSIVTKVMDTVGLYADSLGYVRDTMYLYIDSINLLQDTTLAHNLRLIAIENDTTHFKEAYNDKINSASFGTGTGILTLTQQDAGTVTTSLDGRYSLSSVHNTLANDTWFYSYDFVGNLIGAWKISKDNTWVFATPVELASLRLLPDSRYTIANVPIVSAPYGDTISIALTIDDKRLIQASMVSDGAGTGITPTVQISGVLRVLDSIVGTYARLTAQLQADSVNAVSKYLLNGVDIRNTGTLDTLAYKDQDNNFSVGQTTTDLYATDSITANSVDVADTITTAYLKIPTGASSGYVWKSDADGLGSWQQITNAYKGTWNANTNTPTLADGVGTTGDFYIVSVGDTIDLGSGNVIFLTGGTAIYSGTVWEAINPFEAVTTVNSLIGDVQLELIVVGDSVLTLTGGVDSVDLNPPRYYQKELTADAENNIPVGFPLGSKTKVFYNGVLVEQNKWTGTGTSTITFVLDTRKYDVVTITN